MKKLETVEEAFESIGDMLSVASNAGKFLVAVWDVDDKGEMRCRRTTWQFPMLRFQEACDQLLGILKEEEPPMPAPLPIADFLKDFGKRFPFGGGEPPAIVPTEEATNTLEVDDEAKSEEVSDEKAP